MPFQNPYICITEKLIACKLQKCIFECCVGYCDRTPGSQRMTHMHSRKEYFYLYSKVNKCPAAINEEFAKFENADLWQLSKVARSTL